MVMARRRTRKAKKIETGMHEEEEEGEEKKDRLSDLPDAIILHILSLMETRFSVRTCVLSKKWRCMWHSLPDLNLRRCKDQFGFNEFVRQVLARRHDIPLTKLSLSYFGIRLNMSLIQTVLNYAVTHRVKHLSIHLPCAPSSPVSSCETLRTLELFGIGDAALVLRETFSPLTSLTTLLISCCSFSATQTSFDPLQGLINLKNLQLDHCFLRGFLKISAPKLDSLDLKVIIPYNGCKIEIAAPKLSSFSFQDIYLGELESLVLDLPALENAYIDVRLTNFPWEVKKDSLKLRLILINLFRGLFNVQSLKLSSRTIEIFMDLPGIVEDKPSPFGIPKSLYLPSPFRILKSLKLQCMDNSGNIAQSLIHYFKSGCESVKIQLY